MIDIPDFVYPKDSNGNALCPRCKKLLAQCDCPSFEVSKPKAAPLTPIIRLDKSGRRGKVVTLISNLPRIESSLKALTKELKMKTGSGGTFYLTEEAGVIEIQGDHQKAIKVFFTNHGKKK